MQQGVILVEGYTESDFVKTVLNPHLHTRGLRLQVVVNETSQGYVGGSATYGTIRKQILQYLHHRSQPVVVTTMFDLFGLPKDFPGKMQTSQGTGRQRVEHLESQWKENIGKDHRRFLPYISCHEFEALLFARPQIIAEQFPRTKRLASRLLRIRRKFASPEEINDTEPPSRRIMALVRDYQKRRDGILIARTIGLPRIRAECPHFDQWVERLENLVEAK